VGAIVLAFQPLSHIRERRRRRRRSFVLFFCCAMPPAVYKRVSQESFDEVVQGNIDDFEMVSVKRTATVPSTHGDTCVRVCACVSAIC
jgi:hypothetical protein